MINKKKKGTYSLTLKIVDFGYITKKDEFNEKFKKVIDCETLNHHIDGSKIKFKRTDKNYNTGEMTTEYRSNIIYSLYQEDAPLEEVMSNIISIINDSYKTVTQIDETANDILDVGDLPEESPTETRNIFGYEPDRYQVSRWEDSNGMNMVFWAVAIIMFFGAMLVIM